MKFSPPKWTLKTLLRLTVNLIFLVLFNKKKWFHLQIQSSRKLRRLANSIGSGDCLPVQTIDLDAPRAGWVGHSTCWVQWFGLTVLTDPIWSKRCSPLPLLGPARAQDIPINLDNFARPSLVLISHNHYDHLDLKTLRKLKHLNDQTKILAPKMLGEWLLQKGIQAKSVNLNQTYQMQFGDFHLAVTCTPAIHFSQRTLWDRNQTMWSGWMVEIEYKNKTKTFYYAGDTAFDGSIFEKLGRQFSIDLSFIPIGAYEPRALLKNVHVNPNEAVQIHKSLASKLSIACHHSTFILGDPVLEHPITDLTNSLKLQNVSFRKFLALEAGEEINW